MEKPLRNRQRRGKAGENQGKAGETGKHEPLSQL